MAHAPCVGDEEGGSRRHSRAKDSAQTALFQNRQISGSPQAVSTGLLTFLLQSSGQMARPTVTGTVSLPSPAGKQTHKTAGQPRYKGVLQWSLFPVTIQDGYREQPTLVKVDRRSRDRAVCANPRRTLQ